MHTLPVVLTLLTAPILQSAVTLPPGDADWPPLDEDSATMLYVALNGNDAWSGTVPEPSADGADGPLATLTGAREAIRVMKASGPLAAPVIVNLRTGVHRITEPFTLTPEDSGEVGAPVVYRSMPGEEATVSGGVPVTNWEVRDGVWVGDISHLPEGARFTALWADGAYRHRARTPNEGYFHTAARLEPGEEGGNPAGFRFEPGDIEPWDDLADVLVVTMHSWDVTYSRVTELDPEERVVRFAEAPYWAFEHWGPRQRYFVENVRAALDAPGEWHADFEAGELRYIPVPGESPETTEIIVPVAHKLVVLAGSPDQGAFVRHVHFQGLRLMHTAFDFGPKGMNNAQAAYPVEGAVHANGAHHCSVTGCEISRISNYAVWFHKGCRGNRIARNHIHHLGAGGIRIGDGGDPADDNHVTEFNLVDNNWVHDGGKVFPAAVGVWLGRTSHNTVSHNEISDLFYTGVSVGWSWGYAPSSASHNIIAFNHIHSLGKGVLSDMGGIYHLGVAPGTVLRNNVIHGVHSYSYGGWGVYPDEGSTDLLIVDNIAYRCKTGGFHQHYGQENRVFNNIFALAQEDQLMRTREEDHVSFYFERNIVYFDNGRLLGSNWSNDRFRFADNCYWDASGQVLDFAGASFGEWQQRGHDVYGILADPMFRNPEQGDFTMDPRSPALSLGFRPIDTSRVGLHGDAAWVTAPAGTDNQ